MLVPKRRSADLILKKALELFATSGYHATSVREICEAAGITKPTLYHFYGSKEGVYRALVDGALQEFRHTVLTEMEKPGSPVDHLKRMAKVYFEYGRERPDLARFIFSLVHDTRNRTPATDFPKFYAELLGLAGRAVEEGVARGNFCSGNSELRLLVLMGALAEALCGYVMMGRPDLTPDLADAIVETVVGGWRRPRSSRTVS